MSSVARRSLLTATASAAVLCALSFVPSAPDAAAAPARTEVAAATVTADEHRLADTGGVDTTPYLVGGLASLGIGAACVTVAVRRGRRESYGDTAAL
ncbi:tat (twin-arginine translocation) pathway signal sequence [Streptomyces sp. CA-253872]|uniref:tat (twin-arginine translocation) pathway signal sequence n=1 Tax=Streptomyces sp. CA-253872 TaxID=3240067 RepID=UPI003D9370A2